MKTPAAPVRLGIAGCGNVLSAYLPLADRLRQRGQADIAAFCGREHQRATTLEAWPSAEFITHYEQLLSRQDLDGIVLLTPMSAHAPMAIQALQAKKHVLIEKPMGVTLKEGHDVMAAARQAERLVCCAPFTVLSPTFQTIARRIRQGEIGRVVSARGRYGWAGPDWSDWFYRKGGGALFDLGVYNLTTLTGWLGPVRAVSAHFSVAVPDRVVRGTAVRVETEDNCQLVLDFESGCLGSITAGFAIQQYRGPSIELFGTEGTLNLLGDDWDPDGFELWRNNAGCWQIYKETHPDWPWTDGLRHWVACIRGEERSAVTLEHGFHVLDIMIQARKAAQEGRRIAVQSSFIPPALEDEASRIAAHRVHDRTRSES